MDSEYLDDDSGTDDSGGTMTTRESGMIDFMMAFSLGALFGAGLALFLAPQTGEKTRKELGKKSKKWKKEAGKKLEGAGETLRETGGDWLEEAEDMVGDWSSISEAVESGLQSIRSAVEDEIGKVEKRLGKKKKGLFR
jgi:gas vesicle protein